jgi:hypothetical protein
MIVSGFGHFWKFTEKWEVDSYFSVSGYLDDNISNQFFVALPNN